MIIPIRKRRFRGSLPYRQKPRTSERIYPPSDKEEDIEKSERMITFPSLEATALAAFSTFLTGHSQRQISWFDYRNARQRLRYNDFLIFPYVAAYRAYSVTILALDFVETILPAMHWSVPIQCEKILLLLRRHNVAFQPISRTWNVFEIVQ